MFMKKLQTNIKSGSFTINVKLKVDENATDKLENLFNHYLKVGLLGEKANSFYEDKKTKKTFALIGFFHEFGTRFMPQRSFLAFPLEMKKKNLFSLIEKMFAKMMKAGDLVAFATNPKVIFSRIGEACLNIINEAFDTKGFGVWKPLAPNTIRRKIAKTTGRPSPEDLKILIDTGSLRGAITYEVDKKEK